MPTSSDPKHEDLARLTLRVAVVGVAVYVAFAAMMATGSAQPTPRWYKGNTHTHTINSDGDSTPDDVVRWYR